MRDVSYVYVGVSMEKREREREREAGSDGKVMCRVEQR